MPWYYNTTPHVIRVRLADGGSFGFDSRKDVYIEQSLVSYDMKILIDNNSLKYRGCAGDEIEEVEQMVDSLADVDTSSDKQPNYDNVVGDTDDKVEAVDGLENSETAIVEDSDDGFNSKRRGRRRRLEIKQ